MRLAFTKMHGLGNDFIVFDSRGPDDLPSPMTLRRLADRRTGIGFDQALVLEPPRRAGTDVYYRIFNADGSEVEQCGNGARCIARLVATRSSRQGQPLLMDSPGGAVEARLRRDGLVSVAMGVPDFAPAALPFLADREEPSYRIDLPGGPVDFGAVSIGNPHAVIRVRSVDDAQVDSVGPAMENHARFPRRVNVGFLEIVAPDHVRLRVFERGVGETQACGTGACAAVAVARRHGPLAEEVRVDLPGGRLTVQWPGPGEPIWLTGPAETAFEGHVDVADVAQGRTT
jgi:diaminopimelate epimerase